MPKVSVYLPDDLVAEVRRRGLPLSSLTQQAVHDAIRSEDMTEWIATVRTRGPVGVGDVDMETLMADVRDELGG